VEGGTIKTKQKKMNSVGLTAIQHVSFDPTRNAKLKIAPDILKFLQKDEKTWGYFQKFSEPYKRIRIEWIEEARNRPDVFNKRLGYFLKMTAKNKKYGMMQ